MSLNAAFSCATAMLGSSCFLGNVETRSSYDCHLSPLFQHNPLPNVEFPLRSATCSRRNTLKNRPLRAASGFTQTRMVGTGDFSKATIAVGSDLARAVQPMYQGVLCSLIPKDEKCAFDLPTLPSDTVAYITANPVPVLAALAATSALLLAALTAAVGTAHPSPPPRLSHPPIPGPWGPGPVSRPGPG